MIETAHKLLCRWLAAERRAALEGADAEAAETELSALFARLPEARPRPGFADRVMAAAGLDAAASPAVEPLGWPLRALVAVCLLATGTAVALLRPLAAYAAGQLSLADVVSATARTLTVAVDGLAAVAALGRFLAELYEALLLVVTAPPIAVGWVAALVLTTLALRWLARLLAPSPWSRERVEAQRSSGYVAAR